MSDVETLEVQIAEAFGRLAARAGKSVRECPYEANGNPRQRMLSARFVHAYFDAGGTSPVGDDDQDDNDGGGGRANPVVIVSLAGLGAAAAYAAEKARQRNGNATATHG